MFHNLLNIDYYDYVELQKIYFCLDYFRVGITSMTTGTMQLLLSPWKEQPSIFWQPGVPGALTCPLELLQDKIAAWDEEADTLIF